MILVQLGLIGARAMGDFVPFIRRRRFLTNRVALEDKALKGGFVRNEHHDCRLAGSSAIENSVYPA
jgi:hypothetical protein